MIRSLSIVGVCLWLCQPIFAKTASQPPVYIPPHDLTDPNDPIETQLRKIVWRLVHPGTKKCLNDYQISNVTPGTARNDYALEITYSGGSDSGVEFAHVYSKELSFNQVHRAFYGSSCAKRQRDEAAKRAPAAIRRR